MPDRRRAALVAALLALVVALGATLWPSGAHTADACAFSLRRPHAYEADQHRTLYNLAMDAVSINRLFEGDPFFGIPAVERGARGQRVDGVPFIPPALLRAIAWVESNTTMAQRSVPFQAIGEGLVSFDCGHGIMQVTTGMTTPLGANGMASDRQALIATHYAYNIARGAQILVEKWNAAPEQRPIVGTDTASDPAIVENWYYAVWGYNGFTGPGSNQSNHPLDPSLGGLPRPAFRCDGTQSRNRYPYQELVWGCMANPASSGGVRLWEPLVATRPNFNDPVVYAAMSLANWQFPYAQMDIPTPQPANFAIPPALPPDFQQRLLGAPSLRSSTERVTIRLNDPSTPMRATVPIQNQGSGILTWVAHSSANFLILNPTGGVATGTAVTCNTTSCPDGRITIEVNPTLLPSSAANATVTVRSPNGGSGVVTIHVEVIADFEVGVPGTSRAR